MKEELEQIIEKALNDPNARQKVVIGKVDEKLAEEARKAGFDIEGYIHDIDVSGVRHAFRDHGNEKTESARGQVPITREDIKKIPEIIEKYDTVIFPGKDRSGLNLVKYSKTMSEGTTYYVEEIRTGRKTLTSKSMYKTKK